MAGTIADSAVLDSIKESQTQALLGKFRELFVADDASMRTLRKVVLMTPENIHLNAFMYEPILDMSDEHLRKLYREVCALKYACG
jgi:hypothetical protein